MLVGMAGAAMATPATLPIDGGVVRVRDVATADRGRDLVVLRLPRGTAAVTLTPAELRSLVSNRIPGTRFSLRHARAVRVMRVGSASTPAANDRGCRVTRVDLPAGAVVTTDDVVASACGPSDRALFGYDPAVRSVVARHAVPAGTPLRAVRTAATAPVQPGQSLVLRTAIGPVTIERAVSAVQPARAGARLFARTQDGAVVAARVAAAGGASR